MRSSGVSAVAPIVAATGKPLKVSGIISWIVSGIVATCVSIFQCHFFAKQSGTQEELNSVGNWDFICIGNEPKIPVFWNGNSFHWSSLKIIKVSLNIVAFQFLLTCRKSSYKISSVTFSERLPTNIVRVSCSLSCILSLKSNKD